MSGPDDIPVRLPPLNLVRELSEARDLPERAIAQAILKPEVVEPEVVRVVGQAADGIDLDDRQTNLLFWGIHLLGGSRRPALYRPLMRLLARPADDLEMRFGEALTPALAKVVVGVFDGDVAPLQAVLLAPQTHEMAREALFRALAFLTWDGRVDLAATRDVLARFDDGRPARAGDLGWVGWEEAVGLLGLREFVPRVQAARADARLLEDEAVFGSLLEMSEAAPGDPHRFADAEVGYIEDTLQELEKLLAEGEEDVEPEEPVRNPLRDVGRNDPCPCGSGRKFKKCCLAAGAAAG